MKVKSGLVCAVAFCLSGSMKLAREQLIFVPWLNWGGLFRLQIQSEPGFYNAFAGELFANRVNLIKIIGYIAQMSNLFIHIL